MDELNPFHVKDGMGALRSCWKRADSFAMAGEVSPSHPLRACYANLLMLLDAAGEGEEATDMMFLAWFADKLDKHAQTHMLKDDPSVAAMLHEWKRRMVFNPTCLN